MGKNGTLHSKPSPLMEGSTVKDPPLSGSNIIGHVTPQYFIKEVSIRFRCPRCGKFVNPGFEEVFKEHTHCGQ